MVNKICSKWRPKFLESRIKSVLVLQLSGSTFSEQKWEKICPSNHFFKKKTTTTKKQKQKQAKSVSGLLEGQQNNFCTPTQISKFTWDRFSTKTFWSRDTPPMRQNWLAKSNMLYVEFSFVLCEHGLCGHRWKHGRWWNTYCPSKEGRFTDSTFTSQQHVFFSKWGCLVYRCSSWRPTFNLIKNTFDFSSFDRLWS